MDNPNPNEPPLPAQNNNQSLENQVASLTQQVALLTQLLLQQQANQQAFNNPGPTSSPVIQSEQRSPVNETNLERICKECKDNQKPLYKHFEWCKQCYNRLTTKRRRDEVQNDQDRFVNYCHQAAEIPRRVRRSMEERQNTEVDQAKLEEQHRQAVTSDEEDNNDELEESGEEQKYPMTAERFKKLYDVPTEPAYNSRGKEICVDCGKPEIYLIRRCSKCYNRYAEERYRCNPANYRTCKQCKTPKAFHRGETIEFCYQCSNRKDNRLKRRHSASPFVDRKQRNGSSKLQQTDSSSEYEETESDESDSEEESEWQPDESGNEQEETRKRRTSQFEQKMLSKEEFDCIYKTNPVPKFNQDGKEHCQDCNKTDLSENKHRCASCHRRFVDRRYRANPINWRKCKACKEIRFHRGKTVKICFKCPGRVEKQTHHDKHSPDRRARARSLGPQASTSMQLSRKSVSFASPTPSLPKMLNKRHGNLNPNVRHTPMSQEEFDRVFVNITFEPRFNSRGERICADCSSKTITALSRCSKCFIRYSLERRRADPQHYRLCSTCKEVRWHQSMSAIACSRCYQFLRKNPGKQRLVVQTPKPPQNLTNFDNITRRTWSTTNSSQKGPMTKEEFERAFPDGEPTPKYNSKGQEICLECGTKNIKTMHRCSKCYSHYLRSKAKADPQNYRKCHMCKKEKWHHSKKQNICFNCYQWIRNNPENTWALKSKKRLRRKRTYCERPNADVPRQQPMEQDWHEDSINLDEKPLVMPNKRECNKFRAGWARIRRQIVMKRFHLKIAEEIRKQHQNERQRLREERQRDNIVVPPKAFKWKPEGWIKGQCKVCRVVLNDSIRHPLSVNFCKECSEKYLRQKICTKCGQRKHHYAKEMCKQCYADSKRGRAQNSNEQARSETTAEDHSTATQTNRVKGESRMRSGNFLGNNQASTSQHTQMEVDQQINLAQPASQTLNNTDTRVNRSVSPINLFEFEEPEVIDLTLDDDD